jgi:hypothetical protein
MRQRSFSVLNMELAQYHSICLIYTSLLKHRIMSNGSQESQLGQLRSLLQHSADLQCTQPQYLSMYLLGPPTQPNYLQYHQHRK